ncbi:YjjG family noncanonical pyrimidine nucleotidase [Aquibacillus kalidii]|uniref:YjjG family noncanonical pyrimidine nucleotidase n=1 Tax=Aquibacillus kalidii TaxID=2762597 RepID=UPI001649009D|nr:YjjG family noncanonical pyrimidine nucleotidase [Aquibacillus kalidii]
MKYYKTLLFDIDDTLLDFGAAESAALRFLFNEKGLELTDEMKQQYKLVNTELWKQYEEGEIARDELLNTRFSRFFKIYGKEVDGAVMEQSYREYLGQGKQLMDGAMDLITTIENNYDLYIVTNGVSKTQYKRLHDSGLYPFFRGVFVSEDTGFQKPMKEYFDYAFERIPDFNPEEALIIGDSLGADIKGGQRAGLDTCWVNPIGKSNDLNVEPTYEIRHLRELYAILGVK